MALATWMSGSSSSFELLRGGAVSRSLLEAHEAWRLFSAGFLLPGGWIGLALALYTLVVVGLSLEREVGPWRVLFVFAWSALLSTGAALATTPVRLIAAGAGPILGLMAAEALVRRRVTLEALPWLLFLALSGYRGAYPLATLAGGLGGLLPLARVPVPVAGVAGVLLLVSQGGTLAQGLAHPSATSYANQRFEDAHFAFRYPGVLRPVGSLLVGPGLTLEVSSSDSGQAMDIPSQMAHLAKRFADTGQIRNRKPDEWSLAGRNWMSLGGEVEGVYTRVAFAQADTRVYRVTLTADLRDAAQGEAVLRQILSSFEMPGAPPPPAQPAPTGDPLREGTAALMRRDYKTAEAQLTQALKADPTSSEALLSRSMARVALGDLNGALRDVEGPVKANPMDYRGLLLRGKILGQKKEFDRSLADFNRVLELVSGQPAMEATALRERAEVRLARGDRAGALSDLEKALSLQPENAGLRQRLEEVRK